MRASYGVDVAKFKNSKAVWSQDAMLKDMTKITMSRRDTEEVNKYLTQAGKLFNENFQVKHFVSLKLILILLK